MARFVVRGHPVVWVIVDDQPVADVTSPTTVWSDGFCRAGELDLLDVDLAQRDEAG